MEITKIEERVIDGKSISIYGTTEDPLFLAKDVADWIEHSDVSTMMRTVDDSEKDTKIVCTPGGSQEMWFVTEDGLYELFMQSRKPAAKQFKKKIKEILKDIRKHGTDQFVESALSDPDKMISILQNYKIEKQQRLLAEQEDSFCYGNSFGAG